jgi:hypothetical protein
MAEKQSAEERAAAVAERRENAPAEQPDTPPPPKPGEVVKTDGGIDQRDIIGGGISHTLNTPVTAATKDRTRQQDIMVRASKAAGTRKLAGVVGRPLEEWGLVSGGDRLVGHFILVDLDTLDKVEVGPDEWTIPADEQKVYANAQQLPKLLVAGDGLKKL